MGKHSGQKFFERFSADFRPNLASLYRQGSSFCAGCTKNHPGRSNLRLCRVAKQSDCLRVPRTSCFMYLDLGPGGSGAVRGPSPASGALPGVGWPSRDFRRDISRTTSFARCIARGTMLKKGTRKRANNENAFAKAPRRLIAAMALLSDAQSCSGGFATVLMLRLITATLRLWSNRLNNPGQHCTEPWKQPQPTDTFGQNLLDHIPIND